MTEHHLANTIIKEHANVISTAAETGGAYSILDVQMLPDGSNCLHYHRLLTQTFTALEGTPHVYLGGKQVVRIEKGESYTVKPWIVHGLFNPTKSVIRCRILTTPGLEGYENTMRILAGLAKENKLNKDGFPKNYSSTALLMEMGDIYFTKTHTLFYPWIKWKAKQARKRGIDKAFYENYCTTEILY